MKQHITKEQLEKITKKQRDYLQDKILGVDTRMGMYFGMTIGEMIQYLGEDLQLMHNQNWHKMWSVECTVIERTEECLCDALWEVVKYKLNRK